MQILLFAYNVNQQHVPKLHDVATSNTTLAKHNMSIQLSIHQTVQQSELSNKQPFADVTDHMIHMYFYIYIYRYMYMYMYV